LVISSLVASGNYLVAVLWGREAQELGPLMGNNPRIESAHPSPLSARLGFYGSRPFSKTNQYLEDHGVSPIDWSVEEVA
jgi:uracil-DNA glycosylase